MGSSKNSKEEEKEVSNKISINKKSKPTKHIDEKSSSTKRSKSHKKKKKSSNEITVKEPVVIAIASSSPDSEEDKNEKTPIELKKSPVPKKRSIKVREGVCDGEGGDEIKISKFPMNRIKRIMKCEDPKAHVTQDAVFLVNKAVEMFLERFSEDVYECSVQDKKKFIHYKHLSSVVGKESRYEFLSDFVPEKLKAEDALAQRTLTETG